jgi:predicted nuclease of predicted toxin-antitoxin system
MRFVVDDQLPIALARWLASRGCEAFHLFDLGLTGAKDRLIWETLRNDRAVMVTKDADFINLQRQMPGPSIIWLTLGNCSKASLHHVMEKSWPELVTALEAGETLVEVR